MLLNNPYQVVSMVIDVLTLVVLTLTLAVVFWYTVVTHRMQRAVVAQSRELVRQRQLSNMPALVADIKRLNGADYLQLTNIGKGVAINIAIDDVEIRYPTLQPGHIEFNKVLMLPVGGTASVESDFFITSGDAAESQQLNFPRPTCSFGCRRKYKVSGYRRNQLPTDGAHGKKRLSAWVCEADRRTIKYGKLMHSLF